MRLISRNIQGYKNRDTQLLVGVLKVIAGWQPDMLFFQEVLSMEDNGDEGPKNVLADFWGGYTNVYTPVFSYDQDYGKGVQSSEKVTEGLLVLSKKPFSVEVLSLPIITGTDRRPRSAQIITCENDMIVHTHLSKGIESRKLQSKFIRNVGADVLVGDFNMQPEEIKDSFPDHKSSYLFREYVSFPEKSSTLDYVCIGEEYEFTNVDVDELAGISDHACVMVDVRKNKKSL